ncbi:MAG: hypothetical protein K8L97_15225 [Anaerolineae bacterium]|nr:hypothetical protein [Anaerolineae bacterium]
MPTETPTPIIWPTPTLEPTTNATAAVLIPTSVGYDLAEEVVAGYNRYQLGDYTQVLTLIFLIIGGLLSILRRVQKM